MDSGLARFKHIAVEGVIGVGKTTLARRLADALGASLLLEKPEENPFLEKFYADPPRHALPTQLTFLFQRVEQARELAQGGIFAATVVSDFMFAKDDLFAKLTLSDDEYRLYQRVAADVAPPAPQPDLVIWLRAPSTLLQERIALRGRAMEQGIERASLDTLDAHYAAYFAREPQVPVLAIEAAMVDFLRSPSALQHLLDHLRTYVGPRERFDATR